MQRPQPQATGLASSPAAPIASLNGATSPSSGPYHHSPISGQGRPVPNEAYPAQIARDSNVKADGAGFVTRFHVLRPSSTATLSSRRLRADTSSTGSQPKTSPRSLKRSSARSPWSPSFDDRAADRPAPPRLNPISRRTAACVGSPSTQDPRPAPSPTDHSRPCSGRASRVRWRSCREQPRPRARLEGPVRKT